VKPPQPPTPAAGGAKWGGSGPGRADCVQTHGQCLGPMCPTSCMERREAARRRQVSTSSHPSVRGMDDGRILTCCLALDPAPSQSSVSWDCHGQPAPFFVGVAQVSAHEVAVPIADSSIALGVFSSSISSSGWNGAGCVPHTEKQGSCKAMRAKGNQRLQPLGTSTVCVHVGTCGKPPRRVTRRGQRRRGGRDQGFMRRRALAAEP
jgi:hypothetical protein